MSNMSGEGMRDPVDDWALCQHYTEVENSGIDATYLIGSGQAENHRSQGKRRFESWPNFTADVFFVPQVVIWFARWRYASLNHEGMLGSELKLNG
jgi:hypothetical protein